MAHLAVPAPPAGAASVFVRSSGSVRVLSLFRCRLPGRHPLGFLSGFVLLGLVAVAPARAQASADDAPCEEGPVSRIIIESRPIFDAGPKSGGGPFRWVRQLANLLHVNTREGFIADELLFGEGDCPNPFLLEESERILRELGFIATAEVVAEPQPDGTRHVRVITRDEWTLKIQIDVTIDDGLQFEGASVVEENFLGSGNLIGAFYQERKQRQDYGLTLHSTRLAGTRLDGRFNWGRTRSGGFAEAMLVYPFVGEVGRFAGRLRFYRRESLFPYVLDPGLEYSYALLPELAERIEATQAYRFGEPGDLTLLGFGITHETLRFDDYPGSVSLIRDLDFDNMLDDEPGIGSRLASHARGHELTRFNLLLARRKVRFDTWRGLDAVSGEQSVPQGVDLALTLGPRLPLGSWLSGADGSSRSSPAALASDFMGRVAFFGGVGSASALLLVNADTEARRVRFEDEADGGWRDIFSEADLLAYWQPGVGFAKTLVARVSAAGGWNTISPFQLTLGGRDVVRGYKEEDFPAGRRMVASFENRVDLAWPAPSSIDLGMTFFADAGRAWAGDVPFGMDTGWKTAVGAGLRLAFPAGSSRVTRIDLAWPVGADSGRGPMFRASAGDFIGLVRGFADAQMVRSRRSGVNTNFEGVSR